MIYNMKLDDVPYQATKERRKVIEVRINDEKRELIKTGDKIIFENPMGSIAVVVIGKRKYKDVEELARNENFSKTGGIYKNIQHWIDSIYKYYPLALQHEKGLLAIEIRLID